MSLKELEEYCVQNKINVNIKRYGTLDAVMIREE